MKAGEVLNGWHFIDQADQS